MSEQGSWEECMAIIKDTNPRILAYQWKVVHSKLINTGVHALAMTPG